MGNSEWRRQLGREKGTREEILLMCAVILTSVVGNIGVLVVFSLTPTIRSTLNCYLVNLAVADLLITTLCWPTIVSRITSPLYVLGHFFCRVQVLVQGTCVNVSVLTLGAVACNRSYAVLFPLQAHRANPRLVPLLLLLWGLSFTLAFPGFLVRDTIVYKWNDLDEIQCTDLPTCHHWSIQTYQAYRILVLCIMFFLPGFLMMVGYSVIVVRLWCMRKVPSSLTSQRDTSTTSQQHSPYRSTTASPPAPHIRVRRQIVKMTAIVLLVFALCWVPLHFLWLYDITTSSNQSRQWMEWYLFWAYFLGYTNSALNPLLYWGFSDNFRRGLKSTLVTRLGTTRTQLTVGDRRLPSSTSTFISRTSRHTSSSLSRKSSGRTLDKEHDSSNKPLNSTQRAASSTIKISSQRDKI
ncbi:hypothetical protein Pmani_000212 [Petrolisthes manimaculis]|uniref:G-protein coupled receptors family 1 profile domain-containing protein n=1 Tax=Petrolisthes manimaculis TaxID=1843537 RepID=A0AAE1QMX7_9EUCA|nr:hypothetical protein Pmani_000212 [Petrolisthes manimaculis]